MSYIEKIKQNGFFKNTPVLETERLILRPLTQDDAQAISVPMQVRKMCGVSVTTQALSIGTKGTHRGDKKMIEFAHNEF